MLVSKEAPDSFQLTQRDGRAAMVTVNEDGITEITEYFQIGFEENCRICIGNCCTHSRGYIPAVLTAVSFISNISHLRIRNRKQLGSHDIHIYPKSFI